VNDRLARAPVDNCRRPLIELEQHGAEAQAGTVALPQGGAAADAAQLHAYRTEVGKATKGKRQQHLAMLADRQTFFEQLAFPSINSINRPMLRACAQAC